MHDEEISDVQVVLGIVTADLLTNISLPLPIANRKQLTC